MCVFANVSDELLAVPLTRFITAHTELHEHVNTVRRPVACFVVVCNLVTFHPHTVAPNSLFKQKA